MVWCSSPECCGALWRPSTLGCARLLVTKLDGGDLPPTGLLGIPVTPRRRAREMHGVAEMQQDCGILGTIWAP